MSDNNFRIDWDLRELGPRVGPVVEAATDPLATPAYRDLASTLDFSRLDYGRAVAAGYVPANAQRFDGSEPLEGEAA